MAKQESAEQYSASNVSVYFLSQGGNVGAAQVKAANISHRRVGARVYINVRVPQPLRRYLTLIPPWLSTQDVDVETRRDLRVT